MDMPPTMTIKEVLTDMRIRGFKTSETKIAAAIEQGVYPFGVSIEMSRIEHEIYRKKYYEWLEEVCYAKDMVADAT